MDKQRYTEQQLRFLFEEIGEFAAFFLDLDGLITSWTPSAERCFGWSEEEVKGRHPDFIYTPEDRERAVPRVELETALTEDRSEDKRWHLHKSGQRIFMSGAIVLLKNEAGERTGLAL